MALVVNADIIFTRTQGYLEDTTGDYNASTNPNGYGAPNAAFADFAHYAIVRKKGVNGTADAVMVLDAYNPLSATKFYFDRDVDGWYEGKKLNITIWSAGTYASGTVRYHSGVIYQSNTSTSETPGAGAQWTVVSDLTTIEDNATVTKKTIGRVTAFNADVYWSKEVARNSDGGRSTWDARTKTRMDDIYRLIQAVAVADEYGNNEDGEWSALALIQMGAVLD